MKTFRELIPEIEAGKVVIDLWNGPSTAWYRDDRGKYILKLKNGFLTGDTVEEIVTEILTPPEGEHEEGFNCPVEDPYFMARSLLLLPAWHVIDMSFPEDLSTGVTLFSLRQELEDGQEVSPQLSTSEVPYCIRKDATLGGFIRYTPNPMNDIVSSFASVDDLFSCFLTAHFPIWIVGQSSAYKAMEDEYRQEDERIAKEEAALDAAPIRTIEVTEREYRGIVAERERKSQDEAPIPGGLLINNPFESF